MRPKTPLLVVSGIFTSLKKSYQMAVTCSPYLSKPHKGGVYVILLIQGIFSQPYHLSQTLIIIVVTISALELLWQSTNGVPIN